MAPPIEPERPFISVVIPTYRRPKQLRKCLEAVARQDYPPARFEVIVVDDGSPEPLAPEGDFPWYRFHLQILHQRNAGPAAARNAGAAKARGEILAFTDDDCEPERGWLSALASSCTGTFPPAVGGRTINGIPGNLFSSATQLLIDFLYEYNDTEAARGRFYTSNNLAIPRAEFRDIGCFATGFPLAAGEDRELCDRWLHHGRILRFAPDAVVVHRHSLDLHSFLRQHFNYGRGAHQFHYMRSRRGERWRVESMAFYLGLVLAPFRREHRLRALALAMLLIATQGANAAGFFWQMLRRRKASGSETLETDLR